MFSADAAQPVNRLLIAALFHVVACSSGECLREPERDDTPPDVRITVTYTAPGSYTETTHEITTADSSTWIVASRAKPLHVTFFASDSSGLRRLAPAVSVQRTVGVGLERQFVPIDEVMAKCPVAVLRARYEASTSGKPRVLVVSALAQNWAYKNSSIEPISIRMQ